MSRISDLLSSYQNFISLPWSMDAAPGQRVIFGIYDPMDELKLQAMIGHFELAMKEAQHAWSAIDLEKCFSSWLSSMRYKEKYFQRPELLTSVMDRFSDYTVQNVYEKCSTAMQNNNAVVALYGCGGLFGQLKIKRLIDAIAPKTMGRLLVFFPGTYESNNFRLLNGYDGWNYLAVVLNQ